MCNAMHENIFPSINFADKKDKDVENMLVFHSNSIQSYHFGIVKCRFLRHLNFLKFIDIAW